MINNYITHIKMGYNEMGRGNERNMEENEDMMEWGRTRPDGME